MRMRRAHHRGVNLIGKIKIVGEATLSGDQTRVFVARQRLPDITEAGFRFIHCSLQTTSRERV
jgi:predicted ATP-dependent serine protease